MIQRPGQIALLGAALSVAASAYLFTTPTAPQVRGQTESRVEKAIQQMPIDSDAEKRIERLQPRLARLDQPKQGLAASIQLALLGYREIEPPAAPPEPEPEPAPDPFEYVISMTYVSADRRFAVIDGRFYREGARLPGGEKIVRISPSAVRIQRSDRARWVEIQNELGLLPGKGVTIDTDSSNLGDGEHPSSERRAPTKPTPG